MKFVILVSFLFIFVSISMAGIGDSYMCVVKVNKTIYRKSGKIDDDVFKVDRFTFERKRDRIVSTNSRGHFKGNPGKIYWLITKQITTIPKYFEKFTAQDRVSKIEYDDGLFVYTLNVDNLVVVMVANCEFY